jgi:hypothetical protein
MLRGPTLLQPTALGKQKCKTGDSPGPVQETACQSANYEPKLNCLNKYKDTILSLFDLLINMF